MPGAVLVKKIMKCHHSHEFVKTGRMSPTASNYNTHTKEEVSLVGTNYIFANCFVYLLNPLLLLDE